MKADNSKPEDAALPETANILVVGSVNMDLVMRARRLPVPGETVFGRDFTITPGGKGANQAVAAARLGANCSLIGRIGSDSFGQILLEELESEEIDCRGVSITTEHPTGVAMILVDMKGENAIVVDGGANRLVNADDDIFPNAELFEKANVVLLQLELSLSLTRAAIDQARRHNCKVILDPAPAPSYLPDELCAVDVLSPNIVEAEQITGLKIGEERIDKNMATDLIARGAKAVVAKLGHRGSLVVTADGQFRRVPPYKVNIVNTTGAGDAFTAALAVAIGEGQGLPDAARFANAAGAVACTRHGAIASMPTRKEVLALMAEQEDI